jgi:4-hydroxy-tetrahydrodipicolinate synthase
MFDARTRTAVPLVTPFADGDVDHEALEALVDHLADGVDGFVPCGTTGEFTSLTAAEQRRVIETTVEVAPDGTPVVAGASATAVADVRERMAAAADAGADAAMLVAPYFITAGEPAGTLDFFGELLDDAPLPVYLYNIPQTVGTSLDPETVGRLADHERVVGLKDSSGDVTYVSNVLGATPADFQVFVGYDAALVPSVYLGATGGVNALAHLVPGALADAVTAIREGDHRRARQLHADRIEPLFEFCLDYGFAPAIKAGLEVEGVIPSGELRPPLTSPGESARERIGDALAAD